MNLKAKIYEQLHQDAAAAKISARIGLLKEKGIEAAVIEKDPVVKKLKASMRQAKRRLTQVAAMEKLVARKREEKGKKAAAKREAQSRPTAKAPKETAAKGTKKEAKPKTKKAGSGAAE